MKTLTLALLLSAFVVAQQQSNPVAKSVSGDSVSAAVDPALAADIRRLMDDAGVSQLLKQQVDLMAQPLAELMKQNPNLSPDYVDALTRRLREKLTGPNIAEMAIQSYAKYFTRDDIRQMIAYQESPVGRKARQATPQIMADLFTEMRAYGEKVGREAAEEVIKEHPEYLKKPASAEPATPEPATPPQSAAGGVIGGTPGSTTDVAPRNQAQFAGPHIDRETAEARLLKRVEPAYPPLAKAALVQGTVSFIVIVGLDGKIETLHLVRGHPLLVTAAKAPCCNGSTSPSWWTANRLAS